MGAVANTSSASHATRSTHTHRHRHAHSLQGPPGPPTRARISRALVHAGSDTRRPSSRHLPSRPAQATRAASMEARPACTNGMQPVETVSTHTPPSINHRHAIVHRQKWYTSHSKRTPRPDPTGWVAPCASIAQHSMHLAAISRNLRHELRQIGACRGRLLVRRHCPVLPRHCHHLLHKVLGALDGGVAPVVK